MDAFFASVEQRDFPEYRGKPLIVGGTRQRGVVAAASYEARKYGIRSAMPAKQAFRLCPNLIAVRHRMDVYKSVSYQIRAIFYEYTDLVEPLSLDEAFLDVTENKKGIELAQDIAKEIKERIKTELKLTASAGVSYNKFLAKIASDIQKPDGLTIIHPKRASDILNKLPIEAFWGVGKVTAERMHQLGISNGEDLRAKNKEYLVAHFGKMGNLFYHFARGEDEREVEPNRERLSVGCERTYSEDLFDMHEIYAKFEELAVELDTRIERSEFQGYTFNLKVKLDDFKIINRSKTLDEPVHSIANYLNLAKELFESVKVNKQGIRLLGMSISNPREKVEASDLPDLQLKIPFEKNS